MIGLIVLGITISLLLGYLWLLVASARYVKRRTRSNVKAAIAVGCILLLTVGDTVINRWYHSEVLCKRDDLGVKIFETVVLPSGYWDEVNNIPKLPLTMSREKPFLGRYVEERKYSRGGWIPFTAYLRFEVEILDLQTTRQLGRFVDYYPSGGFWWLFPLRFVNHESALGWFIGGFDRTGPSCDVQSANWASSLSDGVFRKSNAGDKK